LDLLVFQNLSTAARLSARDASTHPGQKLSITHPPLRGDEIFHHGLRRARRRGAGRGTISGTFLLSRPKQWRASTPLDQGPQNKSWQEEARARGRRADEARKTRRPTKHIPQDGRTTRGKKHTMQDEDERQGNARPLTETRTAATPKKGHARQGKATQRKARQANSEETEGKGVRTSRQDRTQW